MMQSAPKWSRAGVARAGVGAVLTMLVATLGACGHDEAPRAADPPPYCASSDAGANARFWHLVEQSCRVATDGDLRQARALRHVLDDLDARQVARFHRTFVRINRALYTREVAAVADDLCLPGLGLGDDLFTDFRCWVMAHGQLAYERVLQRPEALADFPDITMGCGSGEPYGYAAFTVYLHKTGRTARHPGLPALEPATPPAG